MTTNRWTPEKINEEQQGMNLIRYDFKEKLCKLWKTKISPFHTGLVFLWLRKEGHHFWTSERKEDFLQKGCVFLDSHWTGLDRSGQVWPGLDSDSFCEIGAFGVQMPPLCKMTTEIYITWSGSDLRPIQTWKHDTFTYNNIPEKHFQIPTISPFCPFAGPP